MVHRYGSIILKTLGSAIEVMGGIKKKESYYISVTVPKKKGHKPGYTCNP
jgi:hypothetical protein